MTRGNISTHNTDADMGAAVAARSLGLGDALYKDIRPGEFFRFKADAVTARHVKLASGAYRAAADSNSAQFRTGSRTAVFRINP